MKTLGFEQCAADACVLLFIGNGSVSAITVVHADAIFAVGRKSRRGHFCEDLSKPVLTNNLGEFRWCAQDHNFRGIKANVC